MKKVIAIILFVVCFAISALAGELDSIKVKGVDSAKFQLGGDIREGSLVYIVERTTGTCFAVINKGMSVGITKIDCEPLKKIDTIKSYMETGKLQ